MGSPAVLGALAEFNSESERISVYLERMSLFLKANKVLAPTERGAADDRVPVFLSIIGGKTYSLLRDLLAPTLPEEATYDTLTATLKKHFEPSPLVIAERFHFHRRSQASGESIAEFLAELRRLATHCKFEGYLDEALRDRLVCGLRSESIQRKLLSEADLTLARAMELAQGMEGADKNAKSLKQGDLHVNQVPTATSSKKRDACFRCGRTNHTPSNCKFVHATCHSCGKKGHITPACRSSPKGSRGHKSHPKDPKGKPQTKPSRTDWIDTPEDTPPDQTDLNIYCLQSRRAKPIVVELQIEGKRVNMEVDTGAALSLISGEVKKRLFPDTPLMSSQILLQTYTGERMQVLGEMRVRVKYGKQEKLLTLVVVEGNGPNLFGRNWLEHLRLDWKRIGAIAVEPCTPRGVDQLRTKYSVKYSKRNLVRSRTSTVRSRLRSEPDQSSAKHVPFRTVCKNQWRRSWTD